MRRPLTAKGAFHVLKLRAMTLRDRQSERPRLQIEYAALVQALCALAEMSGCRDVQDQIKDEQVWAWKKELDLP